jgi:hypothetical protein
MTDDLGEVYERLGTVERHGSNLELRVTSIEGTLAAHGTKLDQIVAAVSQYKSFKPSEVVGFILQSALLLGLLCSATIYIAGNIHSERLAVIERDIHWMQKLSWKPDVEKP